GPDRLEILTDTVRDTSFALEHKIAESAQEVRLRLDRASEVLEYTRRDSSGLNEAMQARVRDLAAAIRSLVDANHGQERQGLIALARNMDAKMSEFNRQAQALVAFAARPSICTWLRQLFGRSPKKA